MKVNEINPYYILEVIYDEVDVIFKLKKKLNLIVKLSDKEIDDIVNDAIKEVNDENHIPEPIELIVNKYLYNYIKF